MDFDLSALEQALESQAQLHDPARSGAVAAHQALPFAALTPDAAGEWLVAMLANELAPADALAFAATPLSSVSLKRPGAVAVQLQPADVRNHPVGGLVRETLGATFGGRLRFGAGREDLLPQEITPVIFEIARGGGGTWSASLSFKLVSAEANGVATFGSIVPAGVLRVSQIAGLTVDRIGALAYALTLARIAPEPAADTAPMASVHVPAVLH